MKIKMSDIKKTNNKNSFYGEKNTGENPNKKSFLAQVMSNSIYSKSPSLPKYIKANPDNNY
jgi:hypothetical protein